MRKSHNWVKYQNPRNGLVEIKACAKCGLVKDKTTAELACVSLGKRPHRLLRMGWQPAHAFEATAKSSLTTKLREFALAS